MQMFFFSFSFLLHCACEFTRHMQPNYFFPSPKLLTYTLFCLGLMAKFESVLCLHSRLYILTLQDISFGLLHKYTFLSILVTHTKNSLLIFFSSLLQNRKLCLCSVLRKSFLIFCSLNRFFDRLNFFFFCFKEFIFK